MNSTTTQVANLSKAAAATVLLVTLLPGGTSTAVTQVPAGNPGDQAQCRMSPDAVEHWTENGAALPQCIKQANLAQRNFSDDRRQPIR